MTPESPKRRHPARPAIRNRSGETRNCKIEVKVTEKELALIRNTFGRAAAAAARDFWLGFEPKDYANPRKKSALAIARAMHANRIEMEKLRQLVKASCEHPAGEILQAEEQKFNEIAKLCFSNFSRK